MKKQQTTRKRPTNSDSDSSSSSSSADESASTTTNIFQQETDEEQIPVSWRFCDTTDDDPPYVRALLQSGNSCRQLGDRVMYELAELCGLQRGVGTLIRQGDDDDQVYAFATVLDVKYHAATSVVRELKKRLNAAVPGNSLSDLLTGGSLGWIVTERIINMPFDVVPPLFTCLMEDLTWAVRNAKDFDEGDYDFEHFLIIAPCYPPAPPPPSSSDDVPSGENKKNPKRKRQRSSSLSEFIEFWNPDDYVFARHASEAYTWHLSKPPPRADVDEPPQHETSRPWCARILVIPKAGLVAAIAQLSAGGV